MGENLDRLLTYARPRPGGSAGPVRPPAPGPLGEELGGLLSRVNGFYAFGAALHVFPAEPSPGGLSLQRWNAPNGWRGGYGDLLDGHLFFAEDVVGFPFSIAGSRVWSFDPECGRFTEVAESLEEWAANILTEPTLTGWPLARDWSARFGPIAPGRRLAPAIPFMFRQQAPGIENFRAISAEELAGFRADLWRQTRNLLDGTRVQLKLEPESPAPS